jgi:hypothetical protein
VASICVDEAEDSAALSGFVGFFIAAVRTLLDLLCGRRV